MFVIEHRSSILVGLSCLIFASAAHANTTYIVQPGDTACEIAERFSVPCAKLVSANRIDEDGLIYAGQRLSVPVVGSSKTDSRSDEDAPLEKPDDAPAVAMPQNEEEVTPITKSAAQPPQAKTDLWSVYLLARDYDPIFAAQSIRRDSAKQALPQAQAALRPQLSFDSSLSRAYDDDLDHSDTLQTSISLSQTLYNRPSAITVEQAKHRIAAARADYRHAEQELILRAAKAYFGVLAMTDNLVLSEKNQKAIGRQLELSMERLSAGLGTRTDLFDAEARYEGAVADGIEAAKLLDDAKQNLLLLIGRSPGTLRSISGNARLVSPDPNEPAAWIEAALKSNNKLIAEKHQLMVVRLDEKKKRAARLPAVSTSIASSFTDAEKTDTTRTTFSIRLSVPLLKGGLTRSEIKQASLTLAAATREYESSRLVVQTETRRAFLAISSRLRRIEALNEAVRASQGALRAKEEGYEAGLNTNIEVLDGQRDLFSAERNYLKERYDYVLELLQLEALVGDLQASDVSRVNNWLD